MIVVVLILIGLISGSFVNALVWRYHEQEQLVKSKTKQAKSKIAKLSILKGRSMCPHCEHILSTADLIPIFSWLWLRGKCRYCHKSISAQYPIIELLTAALFVFSYYYWPLEFNNRGTFEFALWLVFLIGFVALSVYDFRWHILPSKLIYPLITLAVVELVILTFWHGDINLLVNAFWGVIIIAGTFYLLFQLSDGKWIGGGDIRLGILLGLLAGGALESMLLILIASLSGTLYSLPLVISGRAKRGSQIPFGPFLIIGAIIVQLFGASIIAWYKHQYF